jgi:hypothetical protein
MLVFAVTWPDKSMLPDLERRSWRSLDFLGSFVVVAAATLVVFPFQNAGSNVEQFGQAIFIAPLAVGILCWAGLLVWEWYVERRWKHQILPAFPLSLFKIRAYAYGSLNSLFLGFPFFMVIFTFPLRLQVVNGQSALMAGVMLLPMLAASSLGSIVSGKINATKNYFFEVMMGGSLLMLLGVGLETTLSSSAQIEAKSLGFLAFIGFGFGLTASCTVMLTAYGAPLDEHGMFILYPV